MHPYQWELITSMIAYKVSGGLSIDNNRIQPNDQRLLANKISVQPDLVRKWVSCDRPPAEVYLDRIIEFTSDVFPYKSWAEFNSEEIDHDMYLNLSKWSDYKIARKGSKSHDKLLLIKNWVIRRLRALTPKSDLRPDIFFIGTHNAAVDFEGSYLFFMPGQIPSVRFDSLYTNHLTIYEGGKVKFENEQTRQTYFGEALVKDGDVLQIILYRSAEMLGFEWVFSIQLNKYGSRALHYPGIALSFSGQGVIISYPFLLSTDLKLKVSDGFIVKYFNECFNAMKKSAYTGRLSCMTPGELLKIRPF